MKEKDIEKLINWYLKNKRDLPWRHTTDPYKIWISEVMLQQTRVETVIDYYYRFIKVLPTIEDLAQVSEEKLLKLWEGLGYYSRAKNLKKCAQILVANHESTLPDDKEALSKLPGLGPYTIGAILSIAYQKPVLAVDGNVIRVLSRVYEEEDDLHCKKVRQQYEEKLEPMIVKDHTREFTEGLIELGAKVCLPKQEPLCSKCPLQSCCKSCLHHTTANYPVKKVKTKRKEEEKTVVIFVYQHQVALQKREASLLNGLYEFPNYPVAYSQEQLVSLLVSQHYENFVVQPLPDTTHVFSHVTWKMHNYLVYLNSKHSSLKFYSLTEIRHQYSLPTAFKHVFSLLEEILI